MGVGGVYAHPWVSTTAHLQPHAKIKDYRIVFLRTVSKTENDVFENENETVLKNFTLVIENEMRTFSIS